jgi:N-acetylmuramoyl-L-alanine amidase
VQRRLGPRQRPALMAILAVLGILAACSSAARDGGAPPGASTATQRSAAARSEEPTAAPTAVVHPHATASAPPSAPRPALAGRTIVIDPGHNGGNAAASAEIGRLVNAGGIRKECDTTGTETDDGYPEYAFTLDVADRVATLLREMGARVIVTRSDSRGVGPCIDERAAIGNGAHAAAAISIHADGGPPGGFGFHVIEPALAPDGGNAAIIAPSAQLALQVRSAFAQATGEPYANYIADQGLIARNDLGGLNLSRVPKVFIECANMRNATDAMRVKNPAWRERAAEGIAGGLARFVEA